MTVSRPPTMDTRRKALADAEAKANEIKTSAADAAALAMAGSASLNPTAVSASALKKWQITIAGGTCGALKVQPTNPQTAAQASSSSSRSKSPCAKKRVAAAGAVHGNVARGVSSSGVPGRTGKERMATPPRTERRSSSSAVSSTLLASDAAKPNGTANNRRRSKTPTAAAGPPHTNARPAAVQTSTDCGTVKRRGTPLSLPARDAMTAKGPGNSWTPLRSD